MSSKRFLILAAVALSVACEEETCRFGECGGGEGPAVEVPGLTSLGAYNIARPPMIAPPPLAGVEGQRRRRKMDIPRPHLSNIRQQFAPHFPDVAHPELPSPHLPAALNLNPRRGSVVDQTEPTYFCKRPDFELQGQECVRTLLEPAKEICPGGFQLQEGRVCQRSVRTMASCPPGFVRRPEGCGRILTAPFLDVCPEDTVEDAPGICKKAYEVPLTPVCAQGYLERTRQSCLLSTWQPARAFCPDGFEQVDEHTCVQEETYDCTDPSCARKAAVHHFSPPGALAVGVRAGLASAEAALRAPPLPGTHTGTLAVTVPRGGSLPLDPNCPEAQARAAQIVQPTHTSLSCVKTCTRVTSTPLVYACEEGALHGTRCLIHQRVPAEMQCHALGDESYCYELRPIPALKECPPEYKKECLAPTVCSCVAIEAAAYTQSCPIGYEIDPSVAARSADAGPEAGKGFDGGCSRSLKSTYHCPPGFKLKDGQGGDPDCVKVERVPADCVFSVTYECTAHDGRNCRD